LHSQREIAMKGMKALLAATGATIGLIFQFQ
jgi:hypothetical protein